ncbi:hypothetical protein GY45DRAFT_1039808 [Cubamyces sp. BRFM 1775]|nr:hypothetical protein GY45DRAFT_1039808 [Cubamyces sp. BRFM 1775]
MHITQRRCIQSRTLHAFSRRSPVHCALSFPAVAAAEPQTQNSGPKRPMRDGTSNQRSAISKPYRGPSSIANSCCCCPCTALALTAPDSTPTPRSITGTST